MMRMFPHSDRRPFSDEKCCSLVLCFPPQNVDRKGRKVRAASATDRWIDPEMGPIQSVQSCSSSRNSAHPPPRGYAAGFDEGDEAGVQCSRGSRDDRNEWVAFKSLVVSKGATKRWKAPGSPCSAFNREAQGFVCHPSPGGK
jgi:hypothetical protein